MENLLSRSVGLMKKGFCKSSWAFGGDYTTDPPQTPCRLKLSAASCGESSILQRDKPSVYARLPRSKLRGMARRRIQEQIAKGARRSTPMVPLKPDGPVRVLRAGEKLMIEIGEKSVYRIAK
jgi:hypothetical protein